ncbi:MAG: response regulator, partial [Victivallaceae bacterium]
IPFDKVEVVPKPAISVSLDKTSIFNWADKKVLIVEDDRVNYMLLEKLFEKTGAEIYRAETAREAVDKGLELPDLDLILMDVRLPDFTGWEAAKKIKSVKPDIPIVVQTANAMPEDKEKTFESGCDGYISKPISRNIFYQTMEQFLNK